MAEGRAMADEGQKKSGFGIEEGLFLVTAAILAVAVVLVWMEMKKYGAGPLGG